MGKESNTVAPAGPRRVKPKSGLDPALENGPLTQRGCTDILCCLIFILFTGLTIYITATAFSKGDPWKLAQPYDIDGNPCGALKTSTVVSCLLI
jgi:hypothetical protein